MTPEEILSALDDERRVSSRRLAIIAGLELQVADLARRIDAARTNLEGGGAYPWSASAAIDRALSALKGDLPT